MQEQFFQVSDALSWQVDTQIEHLERFIRAYGAGGRMDAELAELGLSVEQSFHRDCLRDALLNFIDRLGSQGPLSHYLHREMRAAMAPAPAVAPVLVKPVSSKRSFMNRWWPRRARTTVSGVAS
ncbi:MAG: hypothetical protein KGY57_01230 [Gammaproteobacteria bacterium]|nr:hypothetical protein [Gammaproteobacteria bacterium]